MIPSSTVSFTISPLPKIITAHSGMYMYADYISIPRHYALSLGPDKFAHYHNYYYSTSRNFGKVFNSANSVKIAKLLYAGLCHGTNSA